MRTNYFMLLIVGIVILSSCSLRKRITYFQGEQGNTNEISRTYTPRLKADDLLSIIVSADDAATAEPFNIIDRDAPTVRGNSGYTTGAPASSGYLIDSAGMIEMPIIGELKVGGLNRMEATKLIQNKLTEYLTNPIVQIRIVNFKVTVLGDVRSPGTFTIPNERITILEAIGLAGDLTITGNRKNVKVVRNDGKRDFQTVIDLTSQEVFNSPVYYLEQNDIVYIEPNAGARTQSTVWAKVGTFFVSITSVVVSTIAVLTNK